MRTYYAVIEAAGRVVAEYPVEGPSLHQTADQVAADIGRAWPDYWPYGMDGEMPATCWVKLRSCEPGAELADPLYYREHDLPSGRPTIAPASGHWPPAPGTPDIRRLTRG
jgi:hypothetical protein